MSEQEPRREHHIPVAGIFLLFLGIVFLLQTLNVLPWGLWGTLWRFWPVLIIAIGLGILLRRYNHWLVSMLILVLLFACLGVAIWQYGAYPQAGETARSYSEPLGSLEHARVQIDFNAGSLTVGSLASGSPNFVEVSGNRGMRVDFRSQGGEGILHLSTERAERRFWDEARTGGEARFARAIPLTVNLKSAASGIYLDLSALRVDELQMDIDVGNYIVQMPSSAGTIRAYIKVDLANLEVAIPEGVAARLKVDADLTAFEVDESRFPRRGDYYQSPGFEGTENRLELEIDCDLSRVQVK